MTLAGAGIWWDAKSFTTYEGALFCTNNYAAYNPWATDSVITPDVSGEVEELLYNTSGPINAPAGTSSAEKIRATLCFKIPNDLFEDDCLLGPFACRQACNGVDGVESKIFNGEVVMSGTSISRGGSGSATSASASAPITIRVPCKETPRDWTVIYIIAIAIALVILGLLYFRKRY